MSFWDTSAIVPLCINEGRSQSARRLWRLFRERAVWHETVVEVESTLARLEREDSVDANVRQIALKHLKAIEHKWLAIESSPRATEIARTLPHLHGLRALDSLQLAAALIWCKEYPKKQGFRIR
jgi:hypothetical protein